jgi:Uma2 family endonuclease
MTKHPDSASFTADEFLAWALEQPEGNYELIDGRVVAMAPERVGHLRGKAAAQRGLEAAIGRAGLGCEALPDGAAVPIDDTTVYGPDALVRCGNRLPDTAVEVPDPVIVVEVLSPSTRSTDTGAKLVGYFRLPSVRHYLIIDAERRSVTHHHRSDTGEMQVRILREGALELDPPGLTLAVTDLLGSA